MVRRLITIAAVSGLALACTSKTSESKKGETTAEQKDTAAKPVDEDKPPAPKILACDQREFVPEISKQMAKPGEAPEPKRECIDYSKRKDTNLSPSCSQGVALSKPCPDEDVVATCTLESTGTVFKHYKGSSVASAQRMCKTMEGVFAEIK